MRGSLRRRYIRCGKPGCHCRQGKGHGPFWCLSVTLGVGRTKDITIAPEDYEIARHFVDNYKRMKDVLEKVSSLNRQLFQERLLRPSPEHEEPKVKRRRKKKR